MASKLRLRRVTLGLCCALGLGFAAGLGGARLDLPGTIAPVFAQGDEHRPASAERVQALVYAIGSLAVDTEHAAIEIVKLQDRVSRLEAKIEDLEAKLPKD